MLMRTLLHRIIQGTNGMKALLAVLLMFVASYAGAQQQEEPTSDPETDPAPAPAETRLIRIGGSVYGGARQADVGGHTFVHIAADNHDVIINAVYGGNDIAGQIKATNTTMPEELLEEGDVASEAEQNGVDATYNAYIYTEKEADGQHLFIGQLFGGGNGDYNYESKANGKYDLTIDGQNLVDIEKPELAKTYVDLHGGTFGYVYGGGNNATVTSRTDICINNESDVWDINGTDGETNTVTTDDAISDAELLAMGINTEYFNQNGKYHFSRVFGGNNKAAMAIRPFWHLKKGNIDNLYSGGNEGNMIARNGILLEIGEQILNSSNTPELKEESLIEVNNVFGGCRKADVWPMKWDEGTKRYVDLAVTDQVQLDDKYSNGTLKYKFPANMAARVLVRTGKINNVYGGNDVAGNVYGGNAVGIYTSISGSVYGGGNGSYPYTDNYNLRNDLKWGDFCYNQENTINTAAASIDALNAFRPNTEQVSLRVAGTSADKKTIIGGAIYVGGNSATLKEVDAHKSWDNYPLVELKIGSHVIADKVFLGNNGEDMIKEDLLEKFADNDFSKMDLASETKDGNGQTQFDKYMEAAAMPLMPRVVFDNSITNGDPADYIPYSSSFGSFYCGGNVGSMTKDGLININFAYPVIIYEKLVGGCNTADVEVKKHHTTNAALNVAYSGGLTGTPAAPAVSGGIGDKLKLTLNGVKMMPMRWKMSKTEVDDQGNPVKEINPTTGQPYLEYNTIDVHTREKVDPVTTLTEDTGQSYESSDENDLARRFDGGNVYGGCYTSGHVNGNVVINIEQSLIDRDGQFALFDKVRTNETTGEASLYDHDQNYQILQRRSGVILDEQGMDVLGSALNVFGGGKGKATEIWGSTTINHNAGYVFQIFGGSEEGLIGKSSTSSTGATDYTFTVGETTKHIGYDPKYSCIINLHGVKKGFSKREDATISATELEKLAEAEFVYGGGFEGPIAGNTTINIGNARVFNTFAGSCNADILGHTETYIGKGVKSNGTVETNVFPWARDYIYGGNDLGGQIFTYIDTDGNKEWDFSSKVRSDISGMVYNSDVLKAASYVEYTKGHALGIFGGCYGSYDYKDDEYRDFFDTNGDAKTGFSKPYAESAFVHFKPSTDPNNYVRRIYGAGQGYEGEKDKDKMQDRSYVLIDVPEDIDNFVDTEIFGAGAYGGVGMKVAKNDAEANLDKVSTVIDLMSGKVGAAYGASHHEGFTRRTMVNVPKGSTINIGGIFGGGYGDINTAACDAYEANVNYHSEDAVVREAIYGGNNNARRTFYANVNIDVPVYTGGSKQHTGALVDVPKLADVFGAGKGKNTWAQYTNVNLYKNAETGTAARVNEVYGGGDAGMVINKEFVDTWYTNTQADPQANPNEKVDISMSGDYTDEGLASSLVQANELGLKCNTNVHINEGAYVAEYAYGGSKGSLEGEVTGRICGSTYIGLLGGEVFKDIYGGGWGGPVRNDYHVKVGGPTAGENAPDFVVSTNVYIKGGSARNVYGGCYQGSVGVSEELTVASTGLTEVGYRFTTKNPTEGTANADKKIKVPDHKLDETPGITNVVIGDLNGTNYLNGIPAIQRSVYGGGERGAVFGTSNLTINNGYIGYLYKKKAELSVRDGGYVTYADQDVNDDTTTEIDERYVAIVNDPTYHQGEQAGRLEKSGNAFGGGYNEGGTVDHTVTKMYGGWVRGNLFGGGEIAAVGRGAVDEHDTNVDNQRDLTGIFKAGKTEVELFDGHVARNVFGGGRGYSTLRNELSVHYTDGYVFGQTEVHIHGGEVGTDEGLAEGFGNVFGGGDIGYVYSAYEDANGLLCFGNKRGVRYDKNLPEGNPNLGKEGYYYKYARTNNEFAMTDELTEDCKVLIEPQCKVEDDNGISFTDIFYDEGTTVSAIDLNYLKANNTTEYNKIDANGKVKPKSEIGTEGITFSRSYAKNDFVPIYALHTLGNKSDTQWAKLDSKGIIIHNAIFAGGNVSSGSDQVYANAYTVFGNATASIHDVYHLDLITVGTGRTGGLYGEGNLTFVDGYRGLNITNYGTDYYNLKDKSEITYAQYTALDAREKAYYELRYKCVQACTDDKGTHYTPENGTEKASTLTQDEIITLFANNTSILLSNNTPNPDYWVQNGVCSRYAGRLMNTIQRADFCGVFGSRMVMQGAQDRVPEKVDYTNYTINRVREVSLNKKESVIASDKNGTDPDKKMHGNYFGIYNIVNFLGALTSDVNFHEAVRTTDNKDKATYEDPIANEKEYGVATFEDWKNQFHTDRRRNNGKSHNQLALASGVYLELTTEKSTGSAVHEKDWGYITGVVELDLINVQTGIGGGFVYAKNEHGELDEYKDHEYATLTALNRKAVTRKDFTYKTGDNNLKAWETSGNFVHNTQTIIDDCYPTSNRYKESDPPAPAHYWYIKGQVYVYDQYISAYTGTPNAYSETVNIPLTITAASHGTMQLVDVKSNYFAYYSSPGVKLQGEEQLNLNDVNYSLNTPISYWDYYMLSSAGKQRFVKDTYVTIADCVIGEGENAQTIPAGTVMEAGEKTTGGTYPEGTYNYYKQLVTEEDEITHEKTLKPVHDPTNPDKDMDFNYVFRSSNNLSHDTGYILTYKVNNPTDWDTWFMPKNNSTKIDSLAYKQLTASAKENYHDAPTYRPKEEGFYGQREYKQGNIISEEIYTTYQTAKASHSASVPENQAAFEPAYIVKDDIENVTALNGLTQNLNKGTAVAKSEYTTTDTWPSPLNGHVEPAYVCTSTIQLSNSTYIYLNAKMTAGEIDQYKHDYPDLAADIDHFVVPAYYCSAPGWYGGNYYETTKNYRGLAAWSAMSEDDRKHFEFNYDALDLLINPNNFNNEMYWYDGKDATVTNQAGYSLKRPVEYTATYNKKGGSLDYVSDELQLDETDQQMKPVTKTATEGTELSRTEFERLPNDKHHYAPISVSTPGNYYVIKEDFIHNESPYATGQVITKEEFDGLATGATNDQDKVTVLDFTFDEDESKNWAGTPTYKLKENPSSTTDYELDAQGHKIIESYGLKTYYYCRDSYDVTAHTNDPDDNDKWEVKGLDIPGVEEGANITYTTTNKTVPVGVVISGDEIKIGDNVIRENDYGDLLNLQKDFTIHGIAPVETSTLYVSRNSDIFDLSTEKIITVIYKYDYEESDTEGTHITPVSERHVLNIHIKFESGVPQVDDIAKPRIVLPGGTVGLEQPDVKPGAYEVTGGGWELFEKPSDVENHTNGKEYSPKAEPLYWYQDGYYLAYYATTYLGKTYSNAVQVSVANYHDLKTVMDDMEHHYYVDKSNVKRDSKIYINNYSGSEDGLDLLKNLYDLSILNPTPDDLDAKGLIKSGTFEGHAPLDNHVWAGRNLEFFLRTDIDHTGKTWTSIGTDHNGSATSTCFEGILHGDGHTISGLDHSLFGHLCGDVYNLGVTGPFTSAGIADQGWGYLENCWVKSTDNTAKTAKPLFDAPTNKSESDKTIHIVNSYYPEENQYTDHATTATYGLPTKKKLQAFYNGEVAYDLNDFYLFKRYSDKVPGSTETTHYLADNGEGTLTLRDIKYAVKNGPFVMSVDVTNDNTTTSVPVGTYVENRYRDGDFFYANGYIPNESNKRYYTDTQDATKNGYYPIWPNDYIFFGQRLNYGYVDGVAHEETPSAIRKDGDDFITTKEGNLVYRAPAYFRNSNMKAAHFNPYAVFARNEKDNQDKWAYKDMTAIDFTGGNGDLTGGYEYGADGVKFYPPLLDEGGLTAFINQGLTKNLLVYTNALGEATSGTAFEVKKTLVGTVEHPVEPTYREIDTDATPAKYRAVAYQDPGLVRGHWVELVNNAYKAPTDHLLVDLQDFNAPISYTFNSGKRMWYQRSPENYVGQKNGAGTDFVDTKSGWEDISLPFTAELVTTDQKGEITHFYDGSAESENGTHTKVGNEYWLREYCDISTVAAEDKAEAIMKYPANANDGAQKVNKTGELTDTYPKVFNTFLWDYYYNNADSEGHDGHDHLDQNKDTYQTYYSVPRAFENYPLLTRGTPYIIGFPGERYYEFDLSGKFEAQTTDETKPVKIKKQTITFASEVGETINVSDTETVEKNNKPAGVTYNGYIYKPNYLNTPLEDVGANTYAMATDGGSYNKYVPATEDEGNPVAVPVSAFRPYFVNAGSNLAKQRKVVSYIVFSDEACSFSYDDNDPKTNEVNGELTFYTKKLLVGVESSLRKAADVQIVNTSGLTVASFTIQPGETIETPIPTTGVYIIRAAGGKYNRKVTIK